MASAASVSFTCPNCAKVLRASARPAPGRKIKCPSCEHSFVPEFDDEDEGARIQAKPGSVAKRTRRRADEDDDRPRNKKSRADDDDEAPRKKRRRDDDDEEDDDAPSIKKKKKKKSGGSMMLILGGIFFLGGGALLSCVLCGVGAFVWPGFLLSKPNFEAFVAPDANIVMGGSPKVMKAKFANLEKILRDQAVFMGQAKRNDLEDVSMNSEKMLMFGNTKKFDGELVMIFQSTAADIQKIKRNPNLGAAQMLGGHANVHKQTEQAKMNGGLPRFLAFPGGNIVVATDANEATLTAALNRGKEKPQPNATLEMGRVLEKSAFWVAISIDADARREMKQGLIQLATNPLVPVPALRDAAPAVDGIKGFTISLDFNEKQDILLNVNAVCNNPADAKRFQKGIEDAWTVANAAVQLAGFAKGPGMPDIPASLRADVATMKFSSEGNNASARMTLTTKTIEDLAKLGARQMGGGPVAFNPPPVQPPIVQPPIVQPPIVQPPIVQPPPPFKGPKFPPPPVQPPAGGIRTITITNLPAKLQEDREIVFQQGRRVTISMVSTTTKAGPMVTDIDLFVLQGNIGENIVAADQSVGPNGNVMFVAPVTGTYRIRVANLGPGRLVRSTLTINEQ